MNSICRVLLVALAVLVAAPVARAAEEILSFETLIEVETDASVVITETIRVRAEGRQIRRGIFRDIPVYKLGPMGDRRSGGFELLDVERDGRDEPHFTETRNADIRIYAGKKSTYLDQGIYTYTFRYRMDQQVGFFDDFDEIYWNATGTRWSFPIRSATARIVAPEGAKIKQIAAYTGRRGAKGQDFKGVLITDNIAEFTTTRRLQRYEGITVSASWQKGIVAEPSGSVAAWGWLTNNLGLVGLFGGALGALWYYFRTWLRIGRDPEPGVIIPLFAPPDGLSPAAVSYVHYMGLVSAGRGASKALIAAFVSLAVKGKIRIKQSSDDSVSMEVIDRSITGLPVGEKVLLQRLFNRSDWFDFVEHSAKRYVSARQSFRTALLGEHRDVFFKNNRGYFIVGIALTIATIVGFFVLQQPPEDQVGAMIGAGVGVMAGTMLVLAGRWNLKSPSSGIIAKTFGLLMLVAGVGILAVLAWYLVLLKMYIAVPGIVLALMIAALVVFYNLVRAPTPVGRKVMDQIEGFKMYLSVAEAERMNMAGRPDMSETLFEKYLPYAVALGVEKPWSDAFAEHMARMHIEPDDYRPGWYSGRHWDGHNIGRATEGMVSAMSDSMAAATPQSSGSGSSGGGSSGGGGGGGGGGGW